LRVTELQLLFAHAQWATDRVLAAAAALPDERFRAPGEAGHAPLRSTLVHILNAQRIWRRRCEQQPLLTPLAEAEFPTVAAVGRAFAEEWQALFATLSSWQDSDLDTAVTWQMLDQQQQFAAPPWQLLYQCLQHGTQHRSELAETLTVLGQSPGDLDFALFLLSEGIVRPLP
jgi:uncharacterized damage-inducible protein DinB